MSFGDIRETFRPVPPKQIYCIETKMLVMHQNARNAGNRRVGLSTPLNLKLFRRTCDNNHAKSVMPKNSLNH